MAWSIFLIDNWSRALGPGCSVSPDTGWWSARDSLIQCLLSKNNKTHASTGHVTHVYALALTSVLTLPGWSPRTGAHLHHRRIPPAGAGEESEAAFIHSPSVRFRPPATAWARGSRWLPVTSRGKWTSCSRATRRHRARPTPRLLKAPGEVRDVYDVLTPVKDKLSQQLEIWEAGKLIFSTPPSAIKWDCDYLMHDL